MCIVLLWRGKVLNICTTVVGVVLEVAWQLFHVLLELDEFIKRVDTDHFPAILTKILTLAICTHFGFLDHSE